MFLNLKKLLHGTPGNKSRVSRINLWLTPSSHLVISLRKFKTNKNRRSKIKKQWVFKIHFLSFKEVAIVKTRYGSRLKNMPKQGLRPKVAIASLVVIGMVGSLYFGSNLTGPVKLEPAASAQTMFQTKAPQPLVKVLGRSEPTELRVNRVAIKASLISVGLELDGSTKIPDEYGLAGWYNLAPTPGEAGPAIIVGHVDNWQRGPSIFWRLHEVIPGDIVEVDRADNGTIKFRVDEVKQFPRHNLPVEKIYGDIDYAGIRIMTCGGTFDSQAQEYDQNTIVFGTLII